MKMNVSFSLSWASLCDVVLSQLSCFSDVRCTASCMNNWYGQRIIGETRGRLSRNNPQFYSFFDRFFPIFLPIAYLLKIHFLLFPPQILFETCKIMVSRVSRSYVVICRMVLRNVIRCNSGGAEGKISIPKRLQFDTKVGPHLFTLQYTTRGHLITTIGISTSTTPTQHTQINLYTP
ncbi:uncharacterized protein YALI1_F34692g [Yarrowia lipolytica]|jgi:hypothetical protein|uniref:Secreted protein n=1 Tax=Yarrowia lipolytica TaxID=4952 RepID=A0A1D8NQ66_YARLL|nr:hypothetical protein YALI1_F34692g [Yarrowia lipolytica]